ncbi:MAG: FAD-dependent oxidoreductase [Chitinophagales bacterium]|nr:FAD-binding oxidoreductase [Bacteroidota bacterium]MCB9043097.1 FAD-binding oxidoreductase [Chitinophagales bacterium]
MLSYWETSELLSYDTIIIGGGIVGLSAAASLKEKNPAMRIAVIERGILPTGASTRNAGFACFGSVSELLADLKNLSPEQMLTLVKMRWQGLQRLRQRLGDTAIGWEHFGGYELLFEKDLQVSDQISHLNKLLSEIFPKAVFSETKQNPQDFGFAPQQVKKLIFNAYEAQINTGKMMRHLWEYVARLGVNMLTGTNITSFETTASGASVVAKSPFGDIVFTARNLAICTNAFARQLLPKLDLSPGRGQVLITKPLPQKLSWRGIFHYDEGYYYFRNIGDDRILFGGGRNIDFVGENTETFGNSPQILGALTQHLREIIIPQQNFEIAQTWSGIMAFGDNKMPIVEKINDSVVVAVRLGGMGVALGSLLGEKVADFLV